VTLDLFPYQHEGAAFLAGKARAGLFDDMGVGKSAQAIGALDKAKVRRALIVCPAAAREVWIGEFRKFARIPRRVLKARDIQDVNAWLRHKADVLVMSYEQAANWCKHLEGDLIPCLIFDEAHYLKNKQSGRTLKMLGAECDGKHGLAKWAVRVWFLTGTPNPNDAADIWSIMRFCGGTRLSQKIFRDRYYHARHGLHSSSHAPRDEMVPELKQAIRSFSLRRTKEQAGLQLPPIWLTDVTVDGDTREVLDLMRQHEGLEAAILEAIEAGGLSFIDAQHVATLRRLVGEAKTPSYLEILKEELKNGAGKRVVFGLHIGALERVYQGLLAAGVGCVRIIGTTPERERMVAVDRFQNDSACGVFLGNIKAAGTALTLTAAAEIDMLEQSWAPADNAQALMRVHRIGQTRACHARFITLANSIDTVVNATVLRKTANIAKTGMGSLIGA
jgi:SWI/SNF-related matrix-associated actin-dependent regulator 1 of chromatin subfamily A